MIRDGGLTIREWKRSGAEKDLRYPKNNRSEAVYG
jgi:hypothetical protein